MKIAVIGMSGVYPGAENIEQLHQNLLNGVDSIRKVPTSRRELLGLEPELEYQEIGFLEEIENFDHGFFHISAKEADNMSPEQRIAMEMAAKAVLDAGYSLKEFQGTNCGVFVASQDNDYYSMLSEKSGLAWIGSLKSMLAGKISYHLDIHGPNMVIDTGCSSGLVCIDDACRRLERGEIDCALVGGITIYLKFGTKNTEGDLLGIEAGNGRCKPFDAAADGIGVGEGGGFLLLKRLSDAEADLDHIYGVIRASAINGDGARCNSITTPSIEGQKEAILRAWKEGGIHPEEITEIEAHGTGTKLGDPIEVESFYESCQEYGLSSRREPIYLGSIKGNIGHLNATAAIASVTKVLLEFQNHVIYPLCHYTTPNPLIDFERGLLRPASQPVEVDSYAHRLVCTNSFGLSGTNAHIILENYKPMPEEEHLQKPDGETKLMLKLSAKSEASFLEYAKELEHYISTHELTQELIYTLNTGRDDYAYRGIVAGKKKEELLAQLREIRPVFKEEARKTVLVLKRIKDTQAVSWCRSLEEAAPPEWTLYRDIKSLGIKSEALLVDSYGKRIADHREQEPWGPMDEESQETSELSEEKIVNKLNAMCEQEELDVIWIGDYEGKYPCNAAIYPIRNEAERNQLIQDFYVNGKDICWKHYYRKKLSKVSAPAYCFEKHLHWGIMEKQQKDWFSVEEKKDTISYEKKDMVTVLKQIWVKVLECSEEEVGEETDFFDLGGNSLLITLLVEEIEKVFGVELFVEEIYDYGTITQQKEVIKERQTKDKKGQREYELLSMQRLILNSIRKNPQKSDWNLTLTFKISGPLELERMQEAYVQVCRNHPILCCKLVSKEGRDYLQWNKDISPKVTIIRVEKENIQEAEQEVHAALKQEALTPVDCGGDCLAEMKLYHINEQTHYLLFKISHLIADGWSLNLIFDELCSYYAEKKIRHIENRDFSDYVSYEKTFLDSEAGHAQTAYWKNIEQKSHHLAVAKYEAPDSVISLEYILINVTVLNKLRQFAKEKRVSLFQVVLTLYHLTVQDFFGVKDSSIGVMVGNRNNMEYANTVGLFARALLSNVETEEGEAIEDTLQKVRKDSNRMLEQQMCSLGSLIESGKKETFEDFVDFLLTYQNFKNSDLDIEGLQFMAHMISESEAICPMTILFYDSPQAMVGTVQYHPQYFSRQDIKEFIKKFHENVQRFI